MISVLNAERIKFTSVRSPLWCSVIIVALGLGLAALLGWLEQQRLDDPSSAEGLTPLTSSGAVAGVTGFGIMVLMIMAALSITSEYRFGIVRTTFQAIPNRTKVLLAKAGFIGVYGAVLTVVLGFAAFFVAKAMAGSDATTLTLTSAADWRPMYGLGIYALLCAFLAIGIGALLRQSAAAIALLLLWSLLLESLVGLFGSVGRDIQAYLPFMNAQHFLGGAEGALDFPWGPWGSLAYFAGIVTAIFVAAIVVVNKRDA